MWRKGSNEHGCKCAKKEGEARRDVNGNEGMMGGWQVGRKGGRQQEGKKRRKEETNKFEAWKE